MASLPTICILGHYVDSGGRKEGSRRILGGVLYRFGDQR